MDELDVLIEMSRLFGSDPEYLLAGGGNTSLKKDDSLYVKASGTALSDITESGFVVMDLVSLEKIWDKDYPEESRAREAEILSDMMASRRPGETARPSVEALLHSLIRGKYVIHTHPALINGMTCGRDGETAAKELFGDDALWVPLVEPGYILAREIRGRLSAHQDRTGTYPGMIFLQNHGLFVAGNSREEILEIHNRIREKIASRVNRKPMENHGPVDTVLLQEVREAAGKCLGQPQYVKGVTGTDLAACAVDDRAFEPLRLPFNPDQIVYAGPGPMRLDSLSDFSDALALYRDRWNRPPGSFLLKDVGAFGLGETEKKAEAALLLLLDSVKIAVYAESFGGALPMTEELIIFIRDWEVESYRAKVSQ